MKNNREIAKEKLSEFYKAHFFCESPKINPEEKHSESYYIELSEGDDISLWYEWWNKKTVNYFAISVDFASDKKLESVAKKHGVLIPKEKNVWGREIAVCDRISYQGAEDASKVVDPDKNAYMTHYMPSDASWVEYEKCLDRFFNHPFVREKASFKRLVAERIVANMRHLLGRTSLRLVNENHPIGKDKKVLFIQYKPFFAEETWHKNGYHYEFRITDDGVFIEFHGESNVYEQNDILAVGLPLSLKKWGKKGFRLSSQKEEIKFSPENSQDGFVDSAVNRMIEFEKEYGGKILKLIGQEDRSMITKTLELLKSNYNIILHGAPGTGKTYLAKDIASELIFGKQQDKLDDTEKALLEEQTGFVQFHQSYDYTDFVEGLRPAVGVDSKADGFERKDGVFKEFCKRVVEASKTGVVDNYDECFQKIVAKLETVNVIEVPLISGKGNFYIALNSDGDGFVTMLKDATTGEFSKDSTRFFNYEQCYNVYRGLPGTPKKGFDNYRKAIIKYMKGNFGLKDYNEGKKIELQKNKKFIFIIDEINRGEMSKIFGELFFSIDSGYRGERGRIKTQYQNLVKKGDEFEKGFYVPKNVYIIGTMNDIDRSVDSMDFAMRRRFAFEEVSAEQSMSMFDKSKSWKDKDGKEVPIPNNTLEHLKNRMRNLNTKILDSEFNLGPAYQIGAAYFLKFAKYYKNDESDENDAFARLWNYHLKGLLTEYLRGMPKASELLDKLKVAFEDDVIH